MSALFGATDSLPLDLPFWTASPFVLLLLGIAVLPLLVGHWWHRNRNKALVVIVLSLPTILFLFSRGEHAVERLSHEMSEYVSFIILLAALYTIAGGVVVRGDIPGRPLTNTGILAFGGVLANLIGTTGASMLLIRPILRINSQRERKSHLPVFFIFVVSNTGGLLTPLGDPPLFLGFLKGVDFFWTLQLWPKWLLVNGLVLAIFFVWDSVAYARESPRAILADETEVIPLSVSGLRLNGLLLGGVLFAVLFQSKAVAGSWTLQKPWGETIMFGMAMTSLLLTPRRLRRENGFEWAPIVEVAVIFVGIFVTMVPALALLEVHGGRLGVTEPWHYFWGTGLLSSFLDNAPTYLTFGTLAAQGNDFAWLATHQPTLLAAISCGAVFMGANTYIGNGPNFMVKAIAESAGYRMPSFLGYMAYSFGILVPLFVIITLVLL